MKTNQSTRYLFALVLLILTLPAVGQQVFSLSGSQTMKVSGTSTIHDWEMIANSGLKGTSSLNLENGKLKGIKSLTIEMPVKSLKSGKNSMDKNAYEALSEEKFPTIKFELTELKEINGNTVKATGQLTISGKTKVIPMEVKYVVNGNSIRFSGSHGITFKEFGVDPPTAVFGTIKTGNELTLDFEACYTLKN